MVDDANVTCSNDDEFNDVTYELRRQHTKKTAQVKKTVEEDSTSQQKQLEKIAQVKQISGRMTQLCIKPKGQI